MSTNRRPPPPLPAPAADFAALTPDRVLTLLEGALRRRCSNLCRPLTSYINRVYEVQMEDGTWVVVKFYRPGRWSRDALQDEQDFLTELAAEELPVIAPLADPEGTTLHEHRGMYFTVFPRKGGRPCDEPSEAQWTELGRLLARVHLVGERERPRDRVTIDPHESMERHLEVIDAIPFPFASLRREFDEEIDDLIDLIDPLFEGVRRTRIHGDCHAANLICRPGESFYLIDFDDMAWGPAVQDLWMLLPGHLRDARRELNWLLEGYETFRTFDRGELRLIEPLRAMRFVHFTAWCARQKADGGFSRLAPDWGSAAFWKQEIADLRKQRQEIADHLAEG